MFTNSAATVLLIVPLPDLGTRLVASLPFSYDIASSSGAAASTGRYILYHLQELLQALAGIYCIIYRSCMHWQVYIVSSSGAATTARYILHHLQEHWQVYIASFTGTAASTGRYILYHLQKLLQALAGIYCII